MGTTNDIMAASRIEQITAELLQLGVTPAQLQKLRKCLRHEFEYMAYCITNNKECRLDELNSQKAMLDAFEDAELIPEDVHETLTFEEHYERWSKGQSDERHRQREALIGFADLHLDASEHSWTFH